MSVVYLTTPGTHLRANAGRLEVFQGRKKLADLRLFGLERLVVTGGVQLSGQAVALLLDHGIDVAFVTATGRLRGSLVSAESPNVFLRLAQVDRYKDPAFCLELSRRIVAAKIAGQAELVSQSARNHPERVDAAVAADLDTLRRRLPEADSLDTVRGLEGRAAALYYGQLPGMLTRMGFPGRQRRPPKDPVNALLSLGYTLLTNEIAGRLEALGFDPAVGFLHGLRYGRSSLALDLVEPFRQPVVDRLVLRLVNRRELGPDDFEGGEGGGLRLSDEKFKEFLTKYEERIRERSTGGESPTWREVIRGEAERWKEMVLSGEVGEVSGRVT